MDACNCGVYNVIVSKIALLTDECILFQAMHIYYASSEFKGDSSKILQDS